MRKKSTQVFSLKPKNVLVLFTKFAISFPDISYHFLYYYIFPTQLNSCLEKWSFPKRLTMGIAITNDTGTKANYFYRWRTILSVYTKKKGKALRPLIITNRVLDKQGILSQISLKRKKKRSK